MQKAITIIFGVVVLGTLGYFISTRIKPAEPSINWKTFTDTEVGFTFSYPPDLAVTKSPTVPAFEDPTKPSFIVSIIDNTSQEKNAEDNRFRGGITVNPAPTGLEDAHQISSEPLSIDGIPVNFSVFEEDIDPKNPNPQTPNRFVWFTFKKDSNNYLVGFNYPVTAEKSAIIKEILLSFKWVSR